MCTWVLLLPPPEIVAVAHIVIVQVPKAACVAVPKPLRPLGRVAVALAVISLPAALPVVPCPSRRSWSVYTLLKDKFR